jgi:uncharacterized protein (DUF983 family)
LKFGGHETTLSAGQSFFGRIEMPLPALWHWASFPTIDGNCDNCDLDLEMEDSGDGPAIFVMFAIGPIVVGLAVWLEFLLAPPYWLHMVIWPPLVLLGSIALLRPFKATLIALQFRNKAHHIGLNTFDPKD